MSSLVEFSFRNDSGSTIYLTNFDHLMIASTDTATVAKNEVTSRSCSQLDGLLASGDLVLLDGQGNPYSSIMALNIVHGLDDSIVAGGSNGEVIGTDGSGQLVWTTRLAAPTSLTPFHEVWSFYHHGATGDAYMMRPNEASSTDQYPSCIALANGSIVHITSSREKDASKYNNIVIRKQTPDAGTKWNTGTWTDIGGELTTNGTLLSDVFTNLTGYTFSTGDAIAVYLKKTGVAGAGSVEDPAVNLYIKYD